MSFESLIVSIIEYNYIWFSIVTLILSIIGMYLAKNVLGFTTIFLGLSIIGIVLGYYQLWYIIILFLSLVTLSLFGRNFSIGRMRI